MVIAYHVVGILHAQYHSPLFPVGACHPRYRQIGDCTIAICVIVMYYKNKLNFVLNISVCMFGKFVALEAGDW